MSDRIPPQNLEAESAVLGAVLFDNAALYEIREILTASDFYRESHRKIFRAMTELADKSEPIDLLMLSDALKVRSELEGAGGSSYIASLAAGVPSAVNVRSYAELVAETSRRREVLAGCHEAEREVYEGGEDAESIAARLTAGLLNGSHDNNGFRHISEIANRAWHEVEAASERAGLIGMPTGLSEIDAKLGGIPAGELWLVAGRPSMGKTALAVTLAKGAAQRGHGVAFVSVESPANKLAVRLLADVARIENRRLRRGSLDAIQRKRLSDAISQVGELPLWLLDSERSWERIKQRVRGLKMREPGLELVFLDYVGLLSISGPKERYLQLGLVSSEAKALAVSLGVGFVMLWGKIFYRVQDLDAYINRSVEYANLQESNGRQLPKRQKAVGLSGLPSRENLHRLRLAHKG